MSAPGTVPSKEWIGWDGPETVQRLRDAFPSAVLEEVVFRGERTVVVDPTAVLDVLAFLRDDPQCAFDMVTDVTAVHWPGREQPFDIVHLVYSFARNVRFRVKCRVGDPPSVASACSVWSGANWLERECYDMFGVEFQGHPDLRRILMPEGTAGHPLRKEFPLKC